MKKPPLTDEEFDRLLEEAKPELKAMRKNSPPITPERIQRLKKKLEAIHPLLRVMTKQKMRSLILEVFKSYPMDGADLAALISKNNVRLKDASGEGEMYGLLRELENVGVIQGEWKDGDHRRKKVYKLTDLGRAETQRARSEQTELARWLLARAAS